MIYPRRFVDEFIAILDKIFYDVNYYVFSNVYFAKQL